MQAIDPTAYRENRIKQLKEVGSAGCQWGVRDLGFTASGCSRIQDLGFGGLCVRGSMVWFGFTCVGCSVGASPCLDPSPAFDLQGWSGSVSTFLGRRCHGFRAHQEVQ